MKIKSIKAMQVNLPLKKPFEMSNIVRHTSESVVVRLELENAIVGWGEAMPREYVTGETQDSVTRHIRAMIPWIEKWKLDSWQSLIDALAGLPANKKNNCALCAMELALLDAYGKHFKKSVSGLFQQPRESIRYSGILGLNSGLFQAALMRLYGLRDIKVKIGNEPDYRLLMHVKQLFDDVRVDANGAGIDEEAVQKLKDSGVNAVEEPGHAAKGIAIIADESLCTLEDAKRLKGVLFNIRISKCGGLLKSLRILEYARAHKIKCLMGCHVGESGILGAAGRHFAVGNQDLLYAEGGYNGFILKSDITHENLTFGYGGIGWPMRGHGLGISVNEESLQKFAK